MNNGSSRVRRRHSKYQNILIFNSLRKHCCEHNVLRKFYPRIEEEVPQADVAVLSGPSHAEEVGKCIPTTIVVGAQTKKTAEFIQSVFMSDVFRVYTSPAVAGFP